MSAAELDAYDRVTSGFYRDPDPALAALALRQWLRMLADADNAQVARMMVLFYLFARVSQVSPAARAGFAPILAAYGGPHADIVRRLREAADDASFPSAIALPIELPESLDLLWAEFFVTGMPDAVLRVVSTLDWPDRIRPRLEAWLHERALFGGARRREAAAKLAAVGLEVDLERKTIVTPGDLDCLVFAIAERRIRIFELLPFGLTEEDMNALGIKASALWSLRLNARAHDIVAALCREEATRPGGAARALLTNADAGNGEGKPFVL